MGLLRVWCIWVVLWNRKGREGISVFGYMVVSWVRLMCVIVSVLSLIWLMVFFLLFSVFLLKILMVSVLLLFLVSSWLRCLMVIMVG